jgi:hypothetical protein
MANGFFSVTIATKPYLKKYLHALYGNPLIFSTTNYFGMSVAAFLERPIEIQHSKDVLRRRTDKYEDKIEIKCPTSFLTKGRMGFDITDHHTITLNKLFEERFEEDLFRYCNMGIVYKVEVKKSIEQFCWKHRIEIDGDITFDAIKKKEWRYRTKMEEKSPQVSPQKVVFSKCA